MVPALQPQNRYLTAHQRLQLFAHLQRENKLPVRKFRYALAVLAPDTEENMALLFQLGQAPGCIGDTFILLNHINNNRHRLNARGSLALWFGLDNSAAWPAVSIFFFMKPQSLGRSEWRRLSVLNPKLHEIPCCLRE